jgi:hypothetical protein
VSVCAAQVAHKLSSYRQQRGLRVHVKTFWQCLTGFSPSIILPNS